MPLTPRLIGLLTLAPLLWAGNAVVGRLMVPYVPPMALNALRWSVALAVLLVLGWRALASAERRRDIWRCWPYLALVGLLGTGAYNALQYLALATSTPLNATLISSSVPLWMLITGALFFKEQPRMRQVWGALLSLLGVAVVLSRGSLQTLLNVHFVPGDLLMLAAAACWSGYTWLLVRQPAYMQGERQPRITENGQSRPWNWAEFLMIQTLFGLAWAGTAAGAEALISPRDIVWTPLSVLAIVFVGLGPSVLAYSFWGQGVALGGPQLGAFFANLIPVFTAVLSTLLLGEPPHWYHGVAFALIVSSIMVSARQSEQG